MTYPGYFTEQRLCSNFVWQHNNTLFLLNHEQEQAKYNTEQENRKVLNVLQD